MKAVFISYNQALTERVMVALDKNSCRGFTKWELTMGRGSLIGEPHYGTHAWPSVNSSILTFIDDEKVVPLMNSLREVDLSAEQQGLRAFVMPVEQAL